MTHPSTKNGKHQANYAEPATQPVPRIFCTVEGKPEFCSRKLKKISLHRSDVRVQLRNHIKPSHQYSTPVQIHKWVKLHSEVPEMMKRLEIGYYEESFLLFVPDAYIPKLIL